MYQPNFLIEYDQTENGLRENLTYPTVQIREGMIEVPKDPGLGITVDEDVLHKYAVHKNGVTRNSII